MQVVGHLSGEPHSPELAIACFRVAQEALTNIVRHAAARHAWIELSQSESKLELVVRDDGAGFDVAPTQEQARPEEQVLGLLGMTERSPPARRSPCGWNPSVGADGTCIRAAFPLSKVSEQPVEPEGEVSAMSTIRVLLVDDHKLFRAGIRSLLQTVGGIEVVAEAGDGREGLRLIEAHRPDVVLLDIMMPGLNGLDTMARVARICPAPRVVMLSMNASEDSVLETLRQSGLASSSRPPTRRSWHWRSGPSSAGRRSSARRSRNTSSPPASGVSAESKLHWSG